MKVPANRLEAKIAGALSPIYFISGDDPLLVGEAADRIRVRAREEGFGNRLVLNADRSFDWAELGAVCASLSLFADKQLVELRIPTGKPGVAGSKAIKAYCGDPPPDTLLLVLAPRLDRNSMQSAWVRALDTAGVVVQVWPVDRGKLPAWITSRTLSSAPFTLTSAEAWIRIAGISRARVRSVSTFISSFEATLSTRTLASRHSGLRASR